MEVSRKLEKLGMWSSDTAELSFTDVRVPVTNTIGEIGRGFQQQMVQFQAERLITVYRHVGSIDQALGRTRDYLAERRAFGRPLLANQHLQFTLAELAARHDMLTPLRLRRRPTPWCRARTPPASPPSPS